MKDAVLVVGVTWFGYMFFMWPFLYFNLVRSLDKKITEKNTFFLEEGLSFISVLYRAIQYSSLIVFPGQMKKEYYKLIYGEFDFRKNTTIFQKLLAFTFYILGQAMLWLIAVVGLHDLVFFRDSPWLT